MSSNIQNNLPIFITRPLSIIALSVAMVLTVAMTGISQANAELIIHNEANPQIEVAKITGVTVSGNQSQIFNTQFINPQIPSDISIIKLMQVMHIDEQINAIVNGQRAAIEAINNQAQNRNETINDDKPNKRQRELQAQIQGLLSQYAKIMTGGIDNATDVKTMTRAYIDAAKTYYSQAEVDAQIKFYDTNIGQSILAKQPQVTAAFLKQSLPDDMSDTKKQLGDLLPQMKQVIKNIL